MTLRLPDKWIWDFWFAQNGPDYHVFYLQAPRSLLIEQRRHKNATIGHAVSQDLRHWQVLPNALHPGPAPAWDDSATWTGSLINHNGLWHMFYTGTSHAENGLIQRVGLATSTDLIHWQKHPANPIIQANPRYYEQLDLTLWHDQAWRDPWVFRHPHTGQFHAFITARANTGPADERGVIAHARSTNLVDWEVLPPITPPGEFGQLEVPQLVEIGGSYYLLFCAGADVYAHARRNRPGVQLVTGTHYLKAATMLGPFHYTDPHKFLVGDSIGSLYAGKLIQDPAGRWVFMAWHNFASDGSFMGELSNPYPLIIEKNGTLAVNLQSAA